MDETTICTKCGSNKIAPRVRVVGAEGNNLSWHSRGMRP